MDFIDLERTVLKITNRCTLKCKLCLAFIPYYTERSDITTEDSQSILESYFAIVDQVNSFTVTGGEPLLHKNLAAIIKEVYRYSNQIKKRFCIVTNGTLRMKEDVLEALSSHEKSFVVVSNYGPSISTKIDLLTDSLEKWNIQYRIDNYHDSSQKYGGWLDYRDHSLKHLTDDAKKKQADGCFWKQGEYFEINFGELHACARSSYRMHSDIIPKNKKQYIDLLEKNVSREKQKRLLSEIRKLPFLDSCAHCDGNKEGAKRYKPAEQL